MADEHSAAATAVRCPYTVYSLTRRKDRLAAFALHCKSTVISANYSEPVSSLEKTETRLELNRKKLISCGSQTKVRAAQTEMLERY